MNIVYFYENQISLIICRKAEPDILYLVTRYMYEYFVTSSPIVTGSAFMLKFRMCWTPCQ